MDQSERHLLVFCILSFEPSLFHYDHHHHLDKNPHLHQSTHFVAITHPPCTASFVANLSLPVMNLS
jgi:hypothetical protein